MTQTKLKKSGQAITWEEREGVVYISLSPQLSSQLSVAQEGVEILAGDLGRSSIKAATLYFDKETGLAVIEVRKVSSHLTEVPEEKLVKQSGFFKNKKVSASRITFKAADKKGVMRTYAVGERAASIGGKVGINEAKTVDMDKRIIGVFTRLGITNKELLLAVQIPFEGGKSFQKQVDEAQDQVKGGLRWEVESKSQFISLQDNYLRVAPEDYFSKYLLQYLDADKYPCWDDLEFIQVGMGYQTTNITFNTNEGEFDEMLSVSIPFGINQFYKNCAENLGYDEKGDSSFYENPRFIELVNAVTTVPETEEPPGETLIQVPGWSSRVSFEEFKQYCKAAQMAFFGELIKQLDQPEKLKVNVSQLFARCGRFMVVGGGAFLFGDLLIKHLDNYEGFICPLSDIASVAGMAIALAKGDF